MMGPEAGGIWLVVAGGETIASASTPDGAVEQAREALDGRPFSLRFAEAPGGQALPHSLMLDALRPLLDALDMPVYLVGGAVRDALLGKESHDLDFAVPAGAVALAFRLANALRLPAYVLDEERDTGRIVIPGQGTMLDFARFRGPDLEADLNGRDFTINALALPAGAQTDNALIDLFNGLDDLYKGRIRAVHHHSIDDDPLRALRAVRFAQQLGFRIDPETEAEARAAAPHLTRVSHERIRDELTRLLHSARPDEAFRQFADLGLLAATMPEVAALESVEQSAPHFEPVLAHTLRVLGYIAPLESILDEGGGTSGGWAFGVRTALAPYREELAAHLDRHVDGGVDGHVLLRLSALWHDSGKRSTQTVEPGGRIRFFGHDDVGATLAGRRLGALTFSNEAVSHVQATVRAHMRPMLLAASSSLPSRKAIYRYYRDLGAAGLDVALLSLADHLATYDGPGDEARWRHLLAIVERLVEAYFAEHEQLIAPPRLLSGSELIESLELRPGPEVGRLLRLLEEAQAGGEVTTREEALTFARQHAQG